MKRIAVISLFMVQNLFPALEHYRVVAPMYLAYNQTPSGFGKTHFILGEPREFDETPSQSVPTKKEQKNDNANAKVFFAPDDNMRKELIALIDGEQSKITMAIFLLTDVEIAQALVKAKKRGITIEMVTDAGCLKERSSKLGMLCDAGCSVYVYNPSYCKKDNSSLMHHKFALFKKNKAGHALVWTGSFNFTKAGSLANQENAIVLENKQVTEKFDEQFQRLKERSYRYGKQKRA